MKKILITLMSALLFAVGIIAFCFGSSVKVNAVNYNGLSVDFKNGEAYICGLYNYTDTKPTKIEIPSTINGYPVTTIKYGAFQNSDITSVTIGEGVKVISDYAFSNCRSLTSISIPSTVQSIGSDAFSDCDVLSSVYYNAVNAEVGPLTPPFNGAGIRGVGLKVTIGNKVECIPSRLFSKIFGSRDEKSLDVVFEEGSVCRIIDKHAFQNRKKLKSIVLPSSIKEVRNYAFSYCEKLESVMFLGDAPTIGRNAFDGIFVNVYYTPDSRGWTEELMENCWGVRNWYSHTLEHTYGEWVETKTPDCEAAGVESRVCTQCDKTEERSIYATGHTFGDWIETETPTCYTAGKETRTCSVCSKAEKRDIAAREHNFGDWVKTKAPDCENTGTETRKCKFCTEEETREMPLLGHDFATPTVTKQPTCTETGIESGECKNCFKETTNVIPALGHKWVDYTVINEATCTSEGLRESTCSVCKTRITERIPVKEHQYDDGLIKKEATESEEGIKLYSCTVCKNEKEEIIGIVAVETVEPETTDTSVVPETIVETPDTGFSELPAVSDDSDTALTSDVHDVDENKLNTGVIMIIVFAALVTAGVPVAIIKMRK